MGEEDWFDHVLEEPGDEAVVEPGEYAMASDGVLRTGSLYKCIGVGAYDQEQDLGYLTHIARFTEELEDFADDLRILVNLIEDRSDLDDVKFYLAGSGMDRPFGEKGESQPGLWEDLENIGGQRLTAEKFLESYTDDVTVDWGSDQGYWSELVLDLNDPDVFSYNRRSISRI